MTLKGQYERRKKELSDDKTICKENRDLFNEFFKYQERKLKRQNGFEKLDEGCYRTLLSYILKFKNINDWFKNKDWTELTKEDITKVYDNLEDGKILNSKGKPFKDKQGYYSKVFKSKPFALAGKRELAEEVIEYAIKNRKEVSFFLEEDFKKLMNVIIQPRHKALFQLGWDIGENLTSLLKLRKRDLTRRENKDTKEVEYVVNLREEILKRARTPRAEITNYPETAELLDIILEDKKDDDTLFNYGIKQAEKVLSRAIKLTNVKTLPEGNKPKLKDIRSSMACHLLKTGWSADEVKGRLGHKASSPVIDDYVTYLALNKHKPKRKIYNNNLEEVTEDLKRLKQKDKLKTRKIEEMEEKIESISVAFDKMEIAILQSTKSHAESILSMKKIKKP